MAVAILDLNVEDGERAVEELGQKVVFIETDVTKKSQFEDAFKNIIDRFGQLDIVVNNAGIIGGDNYELEISVNSTAVATGTILGMKYMGRNNGANGGVVLNTASVAGITLFPISPIYTATKHFVVSLGKCFGSEFYYNLTGVRVVTFCPTFTATKLLENVKIMSGFENLQEETLKQLEDIQTQSAERCGEEMISAIKQGENGSVWVNLADKPVYEEKNIELILGVTVKF